MPEWTLKYADARGEVHQQVAEADSERELRDRLTDQPSGNAGLNQGTENQ